jgi:hypothetical protein
MIITLVHMIMISRGHFTTSYLVSIVIQNHVRWCIDRDSDNQTARIHNNQPMELHNKYILLDILQSIYGSIEDQDRQVKRYYWIDGLL